MIRRIRDLLYDQGFTISGARNKLQEIVQVERDKRRAGEVMLDGVEAIEVEDSTFEDFEDSVPSEERDLFSQKMLLVRRELFEIRDLLSATH
jgi:hypothetical protein